MDALAYGHVVASRYRILSLLGQGGMGSVYKAEDLELEEVVALKVLTRQPTTPEDPEAGSRFRSEIKLARRVRHRNVCNIHEYGQDGPIRYIAMELVDGADVRHLIARATAIPAPEALDIAIQSCRGLAAIHEEGIVHRDLKPSNIMIDLRGVVRLMDFGVAKGDDPASGTITRTGQVVGSATYMSPEQARGQQVDPRSDIYSLGVVIYEMLTGHHLFSGDSPVAVLLKHVTEPPQLDDPRIPDSVRPLLGKVLAKDPGERPASARDLEKALQAAVSNETRKADLAALVLRYAATPEHRAADGSPERTRTSTAAQVVDVSDSRSSGQLAVRPLAEVTNLTSALSVPLERKAEAARAGLSRASLSRPQVAGTKVFVCYRQDDSADVSGRIHDHLVAALGQDSVFKDVDSIPLGANFKTYLESVVNSCLLQLVIIGRQWLEIRDDAGERRIDDPSDWVRIEIEAALARDIPIIPLLVQGASMPKARQLPPPLQELAYLQGAAVRRDPGFKDDIKRLIGSLSALLEKYAG
jgi:serine/threonine protein kinase